MRTHYRPHVRTTQPNTLKRILFSPAGLLVWIVVCIFVSGRLWQSVGDMRQSLTRQQQSQERLKEEERKALELIEKLNKADTPFAKEKIVRDELQMQKPDETVIQIPKQN